MPSSVAKIELSGGADGLPIAIAASSTPGTNIHTASSNNTASNDYDEVWLWASNIDTVPRLLTIEFGGTAAGNQLMMNIPAQSIVQLLPGVIVENSKSIAAFAASASKINVFGFVNRMTP